MASMASWRSDGSGPFSIASMLASTSGRSAKPVTILLMRVSAWMSLIQKYRPDIFEACISAHKNGHVDREFYRPGASDFMECPGDSIDYAVMEKVSENTEGGSGSCHSGLGQSVTPASPDSVVVTMEADWSDVGSWSALWGKRDQDSDGNVIRGDVYTHETSNSLIMAQNRIVATVGMDDVVVVETSDVVLVARKSQVEDVKEIVRLFKVEGRHEHETGHKVHRPWGTHAIVDSAPGFQVKRLTVNPKAILSLQMHRHRAEHWVVVKGTAKVTKGKEVFVIKENQSTYVPQGMVHRIENSGETTLEMIEVQVGGYLGEDEIVRYKDKYRRYESGSH